MDPTNEPVTNENKPESNIEAKEKLKALNTTENQQESKLPSKSSCKEVKEYV